MQYEYNYTNVYLEDQQIENDRKISVIIINKSCEFKKTFTQ